jgi:aldehyde dehydrogenase (NAD+)
LQAVKVYEEALRRVEKEGGKLLCGGKKLPGKGYFVQPTIVEAPKGASYLQD